MTEQNEIITPVFKNKRKQSITVRLALATPDLLY